MDIHIEPRNLTLLPEWEDKIKEEVARIDGHNPGLIHHFRLVLIGTPHHKLGAFEVHITCTVPDRNIVVQKKGDRVHPLLVEALDTLDLEIIEYNRLRQSEQSYEEKFSRGSIKEIFPDEDYGFILSSEGAEVYFHKNAIKQPDFKQLRVGDPVKFGEELGDKGPQATWVRLQKT